MGGGKDVSKQLLYIFSTCYFSCISLSHHGTDCCFPVTELDFFAVTTRETESITCDIFLKF